MELPLREAGYLLPTWDELVVFSEHAAARGVPLHLDGARLWESAPYLGRSLAEIAALAQTVYVSFYKGLGGPAGAAVAGPADVIATARRWQRRLGGNLFTLMPYAVPARAGLRELVPRMAEFHERAGELAKALSAAGFRVLPDPPHTNAFRLFAEADAVRLDTASVEHMERTRESITACMGTGRRTGLVVDRARGRADDDGVDGGRGGREAVRTSDRLGPHIRGTTGLRGSTTC